MALPKHMAVTPGVVATIDLAAEARYRDGIDVALTAPPGSWWTTDGTAPVEWADGAHTNFWPGPESGLDATGRWRDGAEVRVHVPRPSGGAPVLKILVPGSGSPVTITLDHPGRWAR